jgi:uncharacterized protein (DUF1800 family)
MRWACLLVAVATSAIVAAAAVSPPASAPGNLTATPGDASTVLTWAPVANATGYRVFRTTTSNWEGSAIANITDTVYKSVGLANGTQYFYRVAAQNAGGFGPLSAPVAAVPMALPAAPRGVTATAGDRAIKIVWTAVPGARTYNVYRGLRTNRQASVPVGAGLATPSFLDRTVENGPTYYYKLTALNGSGEGPPSLEVAATPEAPPPAPDPATAAAFQFLRQTTWGPRPGDVDAVKSLGKEAFLAGQFGAPPSTYPDLLFQRPTAAAQQVLMALALSAPDQLRQRVAWALHKIWVVSAVEVPDPAGLVTYHRLLVGGAFGNYRALMRDLTLNAAMGRYLNLLNNRSRAVTGALPNENYARELMQLFTLGTAALTPAGLAVLDGQGRPIPAYTEQDVKELARIFTGWTFGDGNPATAPQGLANENYRFPMEAVARDHDTGAKTFLGQHFVANQSARQDLDQALDLLFVHPNVGPFVGRQLIQQLVTSNPSPAYVAAVAAVFNDNGGGVRGDLAAVVRAIVTHPEAGASSPTSGKLAEPALFVVSTLRALNASVTDYPFMGDSAESMGQKVLYPGSVFSYFSPGYRVRGTAGARGAPIGGPEFQILTTVTALERANFVADLLDGRFGGDVVVDYGPFTSRAGDAAALVDYCGLIFTGGRMSLEERTEIVNAVRRTSAGNPGERVRTALYLTLTAAQAQVDR